MRWWKVLGLAGVVGVAATGAMTVRAERQRRAYTPEEIRSKLHERVDASGGAARYGHHGEESATRNGHFDSGR